MGSAGARLWPRISAANCETHLPHGSCRTGSKCVLTDIRYLLGSTHVIFTCFFQTQSSVSAVLLRRYLYPQRCHFWSYKSRILPENWLVRLGERWNARSRHWPSCASIWSQLRISQSKVYLVSMIRMFISISNLLGIRDLNCSDNFKIEWKDLS